MEILGHKFGNDGVSKTLLVSHTSMLTFHSSFGSIIKISFENTSTLIGLVFLGLSGLLHSNGLP
jgi:uncharacterized membrane protein